MREYLGLPVYTSIEMVDAVTVTRMVKKTFRERWIEPLLHGITMPFEPWVKEKEVTETLYTPSRTIIQTPQGLFMHPEMMLEMEKALNGK